MNGTLYISHPDCLLHDVGQGHPECSDRLTSIETALKAKGLWQQLSHQQAQPAEASHLALVHAELYLQQLELISPEHGHVYADADTPMSPHTLQAARRAAGAGVQAVKLILDGQARNAFCAVRPPGHHAEARQTLGFCFYNNIAIAAKYAMDIRGLARVAIVDFDVHQGNGTVDCFEQDARALVCSSFQHPFYPHTHYDNPAPNIVNIPLPVHSSGKRFRSEVSQHWLQAIADFKPEMLFVSAGFDAHYDDPLGGLQFNDSDYDWITRELLKLAEQCCGGRLVSMLEGGYDLLSLGQSACTHVQALLDYSTPH